ncbi:hypothetical protein [Agrilutibacter solisilvae]|uniref:Uncharacterized protein n=1 Tax=Agrilutibacter solisilvae TaxID=2763317 RepID=A0A975ASA5_9GAMM|nr:hypothetical protein [Lysobacter solisilvae]QSX78547.1 hypothetical protein I8J32_000920 [Lysobacter solisilvae]
MSRLPRALRWIACTSLLAVALAAITGHLLARRAMPDAIADMRRQVAADQVFGQFFRDDGIVRQRPTFTARVENPFVVVVSCWVPTGLHATILQNRYVVMPGGLRRQELPPVHLR